MNYIGIFDSGVGGLGIFQEIKKLLPKENILYLADSANCPYGEKSITVIKKICKKNCQFLLEKGAKMIVVACNSASVTALNYLRSEFVGVPIIGVVPVVKTASAITKNGKIGILATCATINSGYLKSLVKEFCTDKEVYYQAANKLVEMVENYPRNPNFKIQILNPPASAMLKALRAGQAQNSNVPNKIRGSSIGFNSIGILKFNHLKFNKNLKFKIKNYLQSFIDARVDVVTLGCTHFPFLRKEIQEIMGPKVTVLDSNGAVARQVKRVLTNNRQTLDARRQTLVKYKFYTTNNPSKFRSQIHNLLGMDVKVVFSLKSV